jgi:hypothetical protein
MCRWKIVSGKKSSMRIRNITAAALIGTVLALGAGSAGADDAEGCAHFNWDVSRELAVMKQPPQAIAAGKGADSTVQMQPERLYELKLVPQNAVTYAAAPGKPALDDSAHGGLVHFRVTTAGIYRVSLSTAHWIDVVADAQLVKSRDFQGAHGCERPHKIVEFELPAGKDLVLQVSGATAPSVLVAVTAVAPATH